MVALSSSEWIESSPRTQLLKHLSDDLQRRVRFSFTLAAFKQGVTKRKRKPIQFHKLTARRSQTKANRELKLLTRLLAAEEHSSAL
jgi:hypothetical protein